MTKQTADRLPPVDSEGDTAKTRDGSVTPEPGSDTAAVLDTRKLLSTNQSVIIPIPPLATDRMAPRAVYPFGLSHRDIRRRALLFVAFCVALTFLWQVQAILPPFIIAFALAALLDPTVRYLERHGHSRGRAILTLYVLGFCIVALIAIVVVPRATKQIADFSANFTNYSNEFQQAANGLLQKNRRALALFGIHQDNVRDLLQKKSGPVYASITAALSGVTGFVQDAVSRVFWLIIIPLATFFFMRDYSRLRGRLISLFPELYQDQIDLMSREIVDVFSAYLRGLAKVCGLYAITALIILSLLGVQYALFLALVAGAFYAVPYVGQLITGTAAGVVAYLMTPHSALLGLAHISSHSTAYTVIVVLSLVVAQNIFDQMVYPRVVGGSVGLHPVVSIFALMAGATLFGIVGMLLAVPVAASVQLILTYFFPKLTAPLPARLVQ